MTLPTYAQTLLAPTIPAEEAALLATMPSALLAGWSDEAPQRQLLAAEAQALQFEMIQRAALAYAASPAQVRQLRAFLVTQGYSATDAAAVASAWVDVVLEWYQSPRIPASKASWSVPLVASSALQADATSAIVLQALDGTFFVSAQPTAVPFNAGNSYKASITVEARTPGVGGNVLPGSIATVVQGPSGLAVDDTGTQTLLSPARDAETDEDALTRATGRWGTLSAVLTLAGWRYVLLTGVTTLTRAFVDDPNPYGPGSLGIALANAAGAASASEVAAAQVLATRYQIAGAGRVVVAAAAQLTVPVTTVLKTDGTNPLAAAQGASALAQLGPAVDGDWLYVDAVIKALMGVAGVVNVPALSLSADLARPPSGVIVLSPSVTAL